MTNIANRERLLEETNHMIDAMLQVVLPDFMRITTLLRSVSTSISDATQNLRTAHTEIVKELQYHDTLTQKMEHIKRIHDMILSASSHDEVTTASVDGINLIRLNHLQFQVACFEYLSSVNHISSNLTMCDFYKTLGVDSVSELFQSSGLMLSASRKINDHFVLLEKAFIGAGYIGLTARIEEIKSIYSMESERMVMNAYINKPLIDKKELEAAPQHKTLDTEIDLF